MTDVESVMHEQRIEKQRLEQQINDLKGQLLEQQLEAGSNQVCCCFPSETYGRTEVNIIFRSYRAASSTSGGWSRWNTELLLSLIVL